MLESLQSAIIAWNRSHDDRVKLQYVYVFVAAVLLVIAGLAGLVNDSISTVLLQIVFVLIVLFVTNAVSWALLKSFIIDRLPKTPRKIR